MKIAYFLDVPVKIGGAGNLLIQQAGLMAELYDVIVVIPTDENGNPNPEYKKRCIRLHLAYTGLQFYTFYNFMNIDYMAVMNSVPCIEEFARKENITFFHSVQLNPAVEYVSRKLKIPHLMNIYQLQKSEFKLCPGDVYAQYHMCDSKMYSELWRQEAGVSSKCVRPIAIREEIKRKAVYPTDKLRFLMLGDICERKNQLTAIQAVEQCLATKNLELHLAGYLDSDYARECMVYVESHKLEAKVVFHDFVEDITPLLEKCDCLLCTSTDESFPSSMVEAVSYDMTIISTPVAGVPELFIDGYNSFVSDNFTVESIRDCILKCVRHYADGEIVNIHENAQKTWQENFAKKTVRQQIDLYYSEVRSDKHFKGLDIFHDVEKEVKNTERMLGSVKSEGEEWIYTRSLYFTLLRERFRGGKIYIWGAGKLGKLMAEILQKIVGDVEIMAFIDTYREGLCCGIPIIKPNETPMNKKFIYCIGYLHNNVEAVHYLEERGLKLNEQIWKSC